MGVPLLNHIVVVFLFFVFFRLAMAGGTHPLLHDINVYVAQDCTGLYNIIYLYGFISSNTFKVAP